MQKYNTNKRKAYIAPRNKFFDGNGFHILPDLAAFIQVGEKPRDKIRVDDIIKINTSNNEIYYMLLTGIYDDATAKFIGIDKKNMTIIQAS